MNDRYLSRGKRVDNDEWVIGVAFFKNGKCFIITDMFNCDEYQCTGAEIYEVIPETVGQCTGLKDKNGKWIFEKDIVSTDLKRPYNIVVFRDGCFMFNCNDGGRDYYDIMLPILQSEHTRYEYGEVIGNIHDNPELLEVER